MVLFERLHRNLELSLWVSITDGQWAMCLRWEAAGHDRDGPAFMSVPAHNVHFTDIYMCNRPIVFVSFSVIVRGEPFTFHFQ